MSRAVVLAFSTLALAACTTPRPEPEIRVQYVSVPTPVPCVAEVDVREAYADETAGAAPDIFAKVRALLVGIEERKADAVRLKGAVTGCGGVVK